MWGGSFFFSASVMRTLPSPAMSVCLQYARYLSVAHPHGTTVVIVDGVYSWSETVVVLSL